MMLLFLSSPLHPPFVWHRCVTAILASLNPEIRHMGWYYLLVILLASTLALVVALIINNIHHRFPVFWIKYTPPTLPKPFGPPAYSGGDHICLLSSIKNSLYQNHANNPLGFRLLKARAEASISIPHERPSSAGPYVDNYRAHGKDSQSLGRLEVYLSPIESMYLHPTHFSQHGDIQIYP